MPLWLILLILYIAVALLMFARMLKIGVRDRDDLDLKRSTAYIAITSFYDSFKWGYYLIRHGFQGIWDILQ